MFLLIKTNTCIRGYHEDFKIGKEKRRRKYKDCIDFSTHCVRLKYKPSYMCVQNDRTAIRAYPMNTHVVLKWDTLFFSFDFFFIFNLIFFLCQIDPGQFTFNFVMI